MSTSQSEELTKDNNLIKEIYNFYSIIIWLYENSNLDLNIKKNEKLFELIYEPMMIQYKEVFDKLINTEYGDYNLGIMTGFNLAVSLKNKIFDINQHLDTNFMEKKESIIDIKKMFLTGDKKLNHMFKLGYKLDSSGLFD